MSIANSAWRNTASVGSRDSDRLPADDGTARKQSRSGAATHAATRNGRMRGRSGIRTWCRRRLDCSCRSQNMAAAMPDCRLITVPGIGIHESPIGGSLRRIFGAWFGGLPGSEVAIQLRAKDPTPPTGPGPAARSAAGSGQGSRGYPCREDMTAPVTQFRA